MPKIALGHPTLSLATLADLAADGARIELDRGGRSLVKKCRAVVDRALKGGATMYGINTCCGRLAGGRVAAYQHSQLQRNVPLSHATRVGETLEDGTSPLCVA